MYENTRYLMIVFGQRKWMTFHQCARTLDASYPVEDGAVAIDLDSTDIVERPLTEAEKNAITNAADDYSGAR